MNISVRQLCEKLAHFYWSPMHPDTYLVKHPHTGADIGIGRIAHECYASFNLAYLTVGRNLSNINQHNLAIQNFIAAKRELAAEIEGHPLSSYVLVMSEREFQAWYAKNKASIPTEACICIDRAFHNVHKLREI